jgi:hypothetical protein
VEAIRPDGKPYLVAIYGARVMFVVPKEPVKDF